MSVYFAEFSDSGERISGYVADGMPLSYEEIKKLHPKAIEISEEDQLLYLGFPTAEAPYGYIRDMVTGKPVKREAPKMSLELVKTVKNIEIDKKAEEKYCAGFYSEASGAKLWYDSDKDTQTKLAGIYQQTKESDWETVERYPWISPAGKAPVRARLTENSPGTEKTIQQLGAEQIKVLFDDLSAHLFSVNVWVWGKKKEVADATTVEQVEQIVV